MIMTGGKTSGRGGRRVMSSQRQLNGGLVEVAAGKWGHRSCQVR